MKQKTSRWLEPGLALAALVAAAVNGLPYLAGYGHHNYNCLTQLLPCIAYSHADTPAGLLSVLLSLALLVGITAVAVLHAREQRAHLVYILLLLAAVYWVAFIVVEGGFFVVGYQLSAVLLVLVCLAALAKQQGRRGLRIGTALVALGIAAAVWFFSGLESMALAPCIPFAFPICAPNIVPYPPDARDSLLYSVPIAEDASGHFFGYERFTAAELNRIHQGSKLRPLRFVNADTPSTQPDIVSVNPIDHFTWSEVALSSSGRCYALLVDDHGGIPHVSYGLLSPGSACEASIATPAAVTEKQWSDQ